MNTPSTTKSSQNRAPIMEGMVMEEYQLEREKTAEDLAKDSMLAKLEEENSNNWKTMLEATPAPEVRQSEVLIGGQKELSFQHPEVVQTIEAPTPEAVETTPAVYEQPPVEATPSQSSDSSEPGLVDFGFFFNKTGEAVFPKVASIFKGIFSLFGELVAQAYIIIPNHILLKPEKKKTPEEEEAERIAKGQAQVKRENVQRVVSQDQAAIAQKQRTDQQKRGSAAKKLGLNESYEGVMTNGVLRSDLEQELAKKDNEETEEQEKSRKRRSMLASQSGSKKKGPQQPGKKQPIEDMNLATEKQSHWSKAIG